MNEKILIIDDEESIVKFIKDSLICDGYSVITAYNGIDAEKRIQENPDLILLDIMMPDINGFSICQSIRKKVVCPIIFLSACQLEEDRIKGFAIGGDD